MYVQYTHIVVQVVGLMNADIFFLDSRLGTNKYCVQCDILDNAWNIYGCGVGVWSPTFLVAFASWHARIFNMGSMQLATNESQQIEIPVLLYFI